MQILSLHIHPVKSAKMITLDQANIGPLGLEHDRRWMIVDAQGRFITQRECQPLSQLVATPVKTGLRLEINGNQLDVPIPATTQRRDVSVWSSQVSAADCGAEAQRFLQTNFGSDFSLVYCDSSVKRATDPDWSDRQTHVSFADGFPLLIANQASLDALNDRLVDKGEMPVSMTRFRPNIVITDAPAWAEDGWQTLKIGDILFDLVKPCTRCIMTTNDPETGERKNNEPLATLAQFRRSGDIRVCGVLFGWNAIPRSNGTLRVGDEIIIETERSTPWPIMPPKSRSKV